MDGSLYKITIFPIDPLDPQESSSAQHLAAEVAVGLGADKATLTLVTDCAAVVAGYVAAVARVVTCRGSMPASGST